MALPVTDLIAFVSYVGAMSITPGPNNAMLATLGARHGWRGAAPAAVGVLVGMFVLALVAGTGVGAAVAAAPTVKNLLVTLGVAYMAYLSVVLWRADPSKPGKERPPMGFWGAVVFQALNPKGLLMALTAAGGFLIPAAGLAEMVTMAAMYAGIAVPCVAVWALLGDRMRQWLSTPARAQAFSRTMALVVFATAVAMAIES